MYGYEHLYEPANESILSSFVSGIKRVVKAFSKWLIDMIKKIGNAFKNLFRKRRESTKTSRSSFDRNTMQTCISDICNNVENLFTSCDNCISNIFQNHESDSFDSDTFAEAFHDVDDKVFNIENNFSRLNSLHLTDDAIKEGYGSLKHIYDINGKFGQTINQVKDIHNSSNDNKTKPILGKIIKTYGYGINATKKFGQKIMDDIDHELNDDDYFGLSVSRSDFDDMSLDSVGVKTLTKLYDIAYEDAMDSIVNNERYISIYNSVPSAFD